MKNITVSVGEDVYHRARIRAAERKTSVSAIVRQLLEDVSREKTEFEQLQDLEGQALREIGLKPFSAADRIDRDKLHGRDAFR